MKPPSGLTYLLPSNNSPGPPVRPPTDGPGLARRKVRLDAPMTKPILAKS